MSDKPQRGARKPAAFPERSAARLAAVQALYQIDMTGAQTETVLGEFVKHRLGQEVDGDQYVAADPQLFANILRGTRARLSDVDQMLGGALDPQWPLERLELLLRQVLRAGAYELMAHQDTVARVLINEYVEIAHAFFGGREPGMVNGVLDRIARSLRPDEF